jgi:hypothetical protein
MWVLGPCANVPITLLGLSVLKLHVWCLGIDMTQNVKIPLVGVRCSNDKSPPLHTTDESLVDAPPYDSSILLGLSCPFVVYFGPVIDTCNGVQLSCTTTARNSQIGRPTRCVPNDIYTSQMV